MLSFSTTLPAGRVFFALLPSPFILLLACPLLLKIILGLLRCSVYKDRDIIVQPAVLAAVARPSTEDLRAKYAHDPA
nr:hypothetical protein [uncultured Desulfobulbus sp.]